MQMFAQATENPPLTKPARFAGDNSGEPLSRRCGRPFENAWLETRPYCFLDTFSETNLTFGEDISPLFVCVEVYKAFFGDMIDAATIRYGRESGTVSCPLHVLGTVQKSLSATEDDEKKAPSSSGGGEASRVTSELTDHIQSLEEELRRHKSCNNQLLAQVTGANAQVQLLQAEKNELQSRLVLLEHQIRT